jgi:hypothetical protein
VSRPAFKPFGYALDYNKEIAADEERLARLERARDAGWVKKTCDPSYSYGLHDLMLERREIATAFGLTVEDRACLADALELPLDALIARGIPVLIPEEPPGPWYRRGDAILKRIVAAWDGDLYTAAELKKQISHAKATLARHRRNKGKYA